MLIPSILITMLFSAFFSGMEIAFVSSNRMLAEVNREKGSVTDRVVSKFYRHPNMFVSTMLVGNNIALVIYGILIARLFDATIFSGLSEPAKVTSDTILSTLIVLFTGEFLPKTLFKANANKCLRGFALPAYLCYIILYPISRLCAILSKTLLRSLGVKMEKKEHQEEFSKVDLDYLVQQSIDQAGDDEKIDEEVRIFQNALEFSDTKVRDCMVPRTEIKAVSTESSVAELRQMFIESGHSKIIVYENDIDNIIGYIHSSELFRNPENWVDHVRTMPFVPETMAAQKLLHTFLQNKKTLGVVVDEFGGTSGIVSLEDIVEEIFGDIEDEHDTSNLIAKKLNDHEFLLSARMEIDKVNEMFNLDLPESDDYMTVGGLILAVYKSFPKVNDIVRVGQYEFKILKNTMTKIELVRLNVAVKN
jgi:CBS domain containing-hemolysin-like protein